MMLSKVSEWQLHLTFKKNNLREVLKNKENLITMICKSKTYDDIEVNLEPYYDVKKIHKYATSIKLFQLNGTRSDSSVK